MKTILGLMILVAAVSVSAAINTNETTKKVNALKNENSEQELKVLIKGLKNVNGKVELTNDNTAVNNNGSINNKTDGTTL